METSRKADLLKKNPEIYRKNIMGQDVSKDVKEVSGNMKFLCKRVETLFVGGYLFAVISQIYTTHNAKKYVTRNLLDFRIF